MQRGEVEDRRAPSFPFFTSSLYLTGRAVMVLCTTQTPHYSIAYKDFLNYREEIIASGFPEANIHVYARQRSYVPAMATEERNTTTTSTTTTAISATNFIRLYNYGTPEWDTIDKYARKFDMSPHLSSWVNKNGQIELNPGKRGNTVLSAGFSTTSLISRSKTTQVAMPARLKGTNEFVHNMVNFTELLHELGVLEKHPAKKPETDVPLKAESLLSDVLMNHRIAQFASMLHPSNRLEGMSASVMDLSQDLVRCHVDRGDDPVPPYNFSSVFSFICAEGKEMSQAESSRPRILRFALIGYQRKACRDYLSRMMERLTLFATIDQLCSEFTNTQIQSCKEYVAIVKPLELIGYSMKSFAKHFNIPKKTTPQCFLLPTTLNRNIIASPFVDAIRRAQERLHLSCQEVYELLVIVGLSNNSYRFHSVAHDALYHASQMNETGSEVRNLGFPFYVLWKMGRRFMRHDTIYNFGINQSPIPLQEFTQEVLSKHARQMREIFDTWSVSQSDAESVDCESLNKQFTNLCLKLQEMKIFSNSFCVDICARTAILSGILGSQAVRLAIKENSFVSYEDLLLLLSTIQNRPDYQAKDDVHVFRSMTDYVKYKMPSLPMQFINPFLYMCLMKHVGSESKQTQYTAYFPCAPVLFPTQSLYDVAVDSSYGRHEVIRISPSSHIHPDIVRPLNFPTSDAPRNSTVGESCPALHISKYSTTITGQEALTESRIPMSNNHLYTLLKYYRRKNESRHIVSDRKFWRWDPVKERVQVLSVLPTEKPAEGFLGLIDSNESYSDSCCSSNGGKRRKLDVLQVSRDYLDHCCNSFAAEIGQVKKRKEYHIVHGLRIPNPYTYEPILQAGLPPDASPSTIQHWSELVFPHNPTPSPSTVTVSSEDAVSIRIPKKKRLVKQLPMQINDCYLIYNRGNVRIHQDEIKKWRRLKSCLCKK